jgi:F-type H+-transporting ATPase subunit epsilon
VHEQGNSEMANTIHVDIVSAEGEIFSGPAKMVFLPAAEGEIGVAPRHAPLLALLKAGEVRVQPPDGEEQSFYVGGGALEVQPTKVTVLADTAARAADLDEAAALAARQRAEEALAGKIDKLEQAEALAELARAAAQLKLIERLRKIRG